MPVDPYGQSYGYEPSGYSYPEYDDYRPWWYDLGVEAIRRGAETAQVVGAGYPQYPAYPLPTPTPTPQPVPLPAPGVQPQAQGIHLSQGTLMLVVGGVLLFMLGKRGR